MLEINMYQEALRGNADAQFALYDSFKNAVKPISYSFYDTFLGHPTLDTADLEWHLIDTYHYFLKKDDSEYYDVKNFFKYIYMNKLKKVVVTEKIKAKNKEEKEAELKIFKNNHKNINEIAYEEELFEDELVQHILTTKNIKFTNKEKIELIKYLYGYQISEIAKEHKLNYSVVFRRIENALNKIRKYINIYMPDLLNFN